MSENNQATTSPQAPAARFGGKGLNIGIAVAAVATVAGIALWVVQLSGGLVQTNMRNFDSWGLYITMFMFLVGLSAGGLIISSVPRAFGMQGFGGISKVAVWTSICCTVLAIGFVVVDLGQPMRLWELFAYSNLGSPLMWDIIVLGTYLILSVVYLWATLRAEAGKVSATALRVVSVIALVCAVLVHSVTAWIFGLQQAHEFWHTALLAPWFVSSALVCGVALVLVVVIALRRAGYMELDQANVVKLVKMLGAFVLVDLYFFGCDLLTSAFPGGSGAEVAAMLTSGPLAPFFWVEVVGCALCAVVCFVPKLRTNPHRGGVAAGHRGHLLQARAAARRRLPAAESGLRGRHDAVHGDRLDRRHDGRLPGHGVLPDAARVRPRAGRGGSRRPHAARGPQVSAPQADRGVSLTLIGRKAPGFPGRLRWYRGTTW